MLDGLAQLGYVGLFIASFLAATVLPFGSEVVFGAVIAADLDLWTCIIIATIGNSLGGMTCYWLGTKGKIHWIEKYMKVKRERIEKMQQWAQNKGAAVSFFVFLPGIGDVIAIALGFMRTNPWLIALYMTLGKFARFVVVGYGLDKIFELFK